MDSLKAFIEDLEFATFSSLETVIKYSPLFSISTVGRIVSAIDLSF